MGGQCSLLAFWIPSHCQGNQRCRGSIAPWRSLPRFSFEHLAWPLQLRSPNIMSRQKLSCVLRHHLQNCLRRHTSFLCWLEYPKYCFLQLLSWVTTISVDAFSSASYFDRSALA